MGKINIALAGVGNCASALLQGIEKYRNHPKDLNGLMNSQVGGYKPGDIQVVAAFDVDYRKVGKPLKEAAFAPPNCAASIYQTIPDYPVEVQMGPIMDGVAEHMEEYPEERSFVPANREPCWVSEELKKSGADLLILYLPVGSEQAARFYAEACLEAGVGLINAIPVFIASREEWAHLFAEQNLPLVGDDVKGQIGATVLHRALARLFEDRGISLERTYQLNFGGNTDFLNMLNLDRVNTKKKSKTQAVQAELGQPLPEVNIHIGPSDYIPWLQDRKVCHITMEGRGFGDVPVSMELKLTVEDSPNSGGVMIDAIRCCKLAQDRGVGGVLSSISAYTMKSPPQQYTDGEALRMVSQFIEGERER